MSEPRSTSESPVRAGRARMTRRGFLKLGIVSGAALAGGSWLFMQTLDPRYFFMVPRGYRPLVLSTKELAVLGAFCDRVITPTAGSPTARQARVAERIDRELSFHQRKLRDDVRSALFVLEHGGWLHRAPTRFTRLAPERQDAYLAAMTRGRPVERQVFANLKVMALFFYYADDRTWPSIHYSGPTAAPSPPPADSRVPAA